MATAKRARSSKTAARKSANTRTRKIATARKAPKSKAVRKPAAKKAAKKTARRPAVAKKSPASKRIKSAPGKSASAKAAVARKKPAKSAAHKKTAASRPKPNAAKPVRSQAATRELSPKARKDLAARHLWQLVEEKKRRAAQTPPWQTIAHHDHPAPAVTHIDAAEPSPALAPVEMPGHRERGGK